MRIMSEVLDKKILWKGNVFTNSLVIVFVKLNLLCPSSFNINKPDVINCKPFSRLNKDN